MKSRLIASLALGAAVVLGATGCSMISPQATTIQYSPADGVTVASPDSPLKVRNALIVSGEEGERGNFVAAIINDTEDSHTLRIDFGRGDDAVSKTVRVPANTVVSLGSDDEEPLPVNGLDAKPGEIVEVSFQSGDGDTVLADVPVLDGTLPYLATLAPRTPAS